MHPGQDSTRWDPDSRVWCAHSEAAAAPYGVLSLPRGCSCSWRWLNGACGCHHTLTPGWFWALLGSCVHTEEGASNCVGSGQTHVSSHECKISEMQRHGLSFQAFPGPDLPVSSRALPRQHSFLDATAGECLCPSQKGHLARATMM